MYVKTSGDHYEMLTLYVDNLFIAEPNDNTFAKVRKTRMDKFTTTNFGGAQTMGIDITQGKEDGTISINQGPYILYLLDKSSMVDCNPVNTPGIGNKLTAEPKGSVFLSKENTIEYQSIVGLPSSYASVHVLTCTFWCHRRYSS